MIPAVLVRVIGLPLEMGVDGCAVLVMGSRPTSRGLVPLSDGDVLEPTERHEHGHPERAREDDRGEELLAHELVGISAKELADTDVPASKEEVSNDRTDHRQPS